MTARYRLVNDEITPNYHTISRCVRGAFLNEQANDSRKRWLEARLAFLSRWFAISAISYAFLGNHFHLLVHLQRPRMLAWSNRELALHWAEVFPPRGTDGKRLKRSQWKSWLDEKENDPAFLAMARARLTDLGWFMKLIKEPMARIANREDHQKGAYWDGRYKSIAILDHPALISTSVYIDLNVLMTLENLRTTTPPEMIPHTSVYERFLQIRRLGLERLVSVAVSEPGPDLVANAEAQAARDYLRRVEQSLWLMPIHDGRMQDPTRRCGMSDRLDLADYLRIVNAVAQERRAIAAQLPEGMISHLKRCGLDWGQIVAMVDRLIEVGRYQLWGRARGTPETLQALAAGYQQTKLVTHTGKTANRSLRSGHL